MCALSLVCVSFIDVCSLLVRCFDACIIYIYVCIYLSGGCPPSLFFFFLSLSLSLVARRGRGRRKKEERKKSFGKSALLRDTCEETQRKIHPRLTFFQLDSRCQWIGCYIGECVEILQSRHPVERGRYHVYMYCPWLFFS